MIRDEGKSTRGRAELTPATEARPLHCRQEDPASRPPKKPSGTRWLRLGSTAAVLILIFLFYVWTVKSCSIKLVSTQPFNYEKAPRPLYDMIWTSDLYGFYNMLADSFLAGKLSLNVEPPKEMLELSNPYDPDKNGRYKMWGASLYKGKYYLYFGPTPGSQDFRTGEKLIGLHKPRLNFGLENHSPEFWRELRPKTL